MTTDAVLSSLERTSRTSAVLMALGALIVAYALWLATTRLTAVQAETVVLENRTNELRTKNEELQRIARNLEERSNALTRQVGGLREALSASRSAIAAFHERDYEAAVGFYNVALAADPGNAYLLNLKAYSLFKLGKAADAIAVQQEGLRVDPSYTWGLFDLARFQCTAGDKAAAAKSLGQAIGKEARFRGLAEQDGEFRRVCGPGLLHFAK